MKAELLPENEKNVRQRRLSIDVSTPKGEGKALPTGLPAFLDFDVPANAMPFSISMNLLNPSAQDASGKSVKLTAEAGKLIVSVPDTRLSGCFFFTH